MVYIVFLLGKYAQLTNSPSSAFQAPSPIKGEGKVVQNVIYIYPDHQGRREGFTKLNLYLPRPSREKGNFLLQNITETVFYAKIIL